MKEDEWFVVRWEELENLRKRDVLSEFLNFQTPEKPKIQNKMFHHYVIHIPPNDGGPRG